MPAILEKRKVLNGRGIVLQWANGNSAGKFFYREKVEGRKAYRFKELPEANNLDEAAELAAEAAIKLRDEIRDADKVQEVYDPMNLLQREEKLIKKKEKLARDEQKKENPKGNIEQIMNDWIAQEKRRMESGSLESASYLHKMYCCRHIMSYIKMKKITLTTQITNASFDQYVDWRLRTTQRRILIQRELSVLGEFIKSYLVKHRYLPAYLWMDGQFLPKVILRETDKDANPAINSDDWRTIIDYVREVWRPIGYERDQFGRQYTNSIWFRNMFWHWLLIAKSTGMSPEEICKLKWKSVEIIDVGRISKSKAIEEYEQIMDELQAEGRADDIEIEPPDLDSNPSDWCLNKDAWGREERLISFITTVRAKTGRVREIPCNLGYVFRRWKYFLEEEMGVKVRGDDYVFAQIENEFKKPNQRKIGQHWRWIVDKLMETGELKGHKFSDRPYTLYSMRSTFIENHLLRGTDIFLLARMCGNSVKTIMDTYERIDIRKRTKEITDIDYGKKSQNAAAIQLYTD